MTGRGCCPIPLLFLFDPATCCQSRHVFIRRSSRGAHPAAEQKGGVFAVERITLMIAVAESRGDVAQVACVDRCTTPNTVVLPGWHPAVHQDELHVAPPRAKQNTVSAGL